jgi:ATP-dependent Lhr-like helicase
VVPVTVAGEARFIAAEDAARYRDALGTPLPPGLPAALLAPSAEPLADLAARYARTHGPFTSAELGKRLGLAASKVLSALQKNITSAKILEGAFRPGGTTRELCEADVLRQLRQKALAKLRAAVEPVSPAALGRHLTHWHHVVKRRQGLDALLDVVEKLQGLPLPASLLDTEILPARLEGYLPADLDALAAAGEVVWAGLEPLGERDGRVALFLTDQLGTLWRPRPEAGLGVKEAAVLAYLRGHGATFFPALLQGLGGGFPGEVVDALWSLVWKGLVTNDTVRALRAQVRPPEKDRRGHAALRPRTFRSRRDAPPEAEGRWSALPTQGPDATAWGMAMAQQLLGRYGVVTREVAQAEDVEGGFTAVYAVLRGLEEAGRVRRGYFVAGVGALQFALPGVLEVLRSHRDAAEAPEVVTLSAIDPANPYGSILPWPERVGARGPTRQAGAQVVLIDGALAGYVGRGGRQVLAFVPEEEPARGRVLRALAGALATRMPLGHGWLVEEINLRPAREHALAPLMVEAGFSTVPTGLQLRRHR